MPNSSRDLPIYSGVLTLVFTATVLSGFGAGGTNARRPGVIIRGKEQPRRDRPYAGMLFYNNEGAENSVMVFGGHKNAKGEVVDGCSLSFDKYDASQVVPLAGVDDKEDGLPASPGATV
jgi:hypothetical protein